jgi:hypothetical protein
MEGGRLKVQLTNGSHLQVCCRCDQARPDPSALIIHAASAAPIQNPPRANRVMVMLRDSSRANARPRITVFPDMLAVNTWLFRKIAASIEPAEPVKRMRNQSRVACGTSFVVDIGGAFFDFFFHEIRMACQPNRRTKWNILLIFALLAQ